MATDDPADKTGKSGLSPNQRAMINDGIIIGANMAGVALTFAGIPGTGPVLAGIGGLLFQGFAPGKSPEAAYYQALSEQIAAMETAVLTDLTAISKQIVGLQTDLDELAEKLSIQINLSAYNSSRAVIDQYYSDFVDHITALSQKADTSDAASKLYDLLQNHSDDVAIQMRILHDTLINEADGVPGLISQQADLVVTSVENWITDSGNYDGGEATTLRPLSYHIYDCRNIIYNAYGTAAGNTLQSFVEPFIQSILILQYRGLTFLTVAWAGSDQTDQLQEFIDKSKEIMRTLQNFIDRISDPTLIDSTVKNTIKKVGFQRNSGIAACAGAYNLIDVANWVYWKSWYSRDGEGVAFAIVSVPDDLNFGSSYNAYSLYPTGKRAPYYGMYNAQPYQAYIPPPSSVTPNPLLPSIGILADVLAQTIAQTTAQEAGMNLVLTTVPAASGGTLAGSMTGTSDLAGAHVQVFAYVGSAWQRSASDVSIDDDGSFSTQATGTDVAFWTVLVTKPGWTYVGASSEDTAPHIGTNVIAYTTLPAT